MKKITILLSGLLLMAGCFSSGGRQSSTPQPVEPTLYGYQVVAEYPHARDSYTQGLLFHEGEIWEGTGQEGASRLLRYRVGESSPKLISSLPRHEFGEGIALLNEELFFLTWMDNTVHIFNPKSGHEERTLRYTGEGWGLTTDGEKLFFSNGSSTLYRLDPQSFKREKAIPVTLRGEPLEWINELEWIEGRIWANIYTSDHIAIIDPETGIVEGLINLKGLLPEAERDTTTDVLNGIAYDPLTKRIFVTGKNWPKLYEITLRNE
uniref:glutaminyl-peptide cyclotransferase n=1 Tax=Alistipes sp. TaxID=1872444 RepID=UPI004056821A